MTKGATEVVEVRLSLALALRVRFAISPLSETCRLIRAIGASSAFETQPERAWLTPPRLALERLVASVDMLPLFVTLTSHRPPPFLAPTPQSLGANLDNELAELRSTPPAKVRAQIDSSIAHGARLDQDVEAQLRAPEAALV